MTIRFICARLAAAALVLLFAGLAAADTFQRPTGAVDLAGYRPDQLTVPVEIAKPIAGSFDQVKLELVNADAPIKGPFERYEVEAEPASQAWRVDAVGKTMQRKPVGRFRLAAGAVTFQWEAGITRVDGGPLRNCVVTIDDGATKHAVALRAPVRQPAWPLDLKKDLTRFALADDLPEATELTLEVTGVAGTPAPAAVAPAETSLKKSSFAELKAADAANPGARLRIVLWKAGLKPEVLVRPEVTPMAKDSAAQSVATAGPPPAGTSTTSGRPLPGRPTSTRPAAGVTFAAPAANADDFDPTAAAKLKTMSFTIRGVADIKNQLNREYTAGNTQLNLNNNQIAINDRELAKWSGGIIGTQAEIQAIVARINRLRDENRQLQYANQILTNVTLPNLSRQIAACPELEKLATALNGKAALSFRVYYTVAGKPVDVLVVGGE